MFQIIKKSTLKELQEDICNIKEVDLSYFESAEYSSEWWLAFEIKYDFAKGMNLNKANVKRCISKIKKYGIGYCDCDGFEGFNHKNSFAILIEINNKRKFFTLPKWIFEKNRP